MENLIEAFIIFVVTLAFYLLGFYAGEIKTKKKSSIERIFRNRKETEPKNYFNNRIKAINKLND